VQATSDDSRRRVLQEATDDVGVRYDARSPTARRASNTATTTLAVPGINRSALVPSTPHGKARTSTGAVICETTPHNNLPDHPQTNRVANSSLLALA
jgi:hypothetical protein